MLAKHAGGIGPHTARRSDPGAKPQAEHRSDRREIGPPSRERREREPSGLEPRFSTDAALAGMLGGPPGWNVNRAAAVSRRVSPR